jgi:hypothetical protein
MKTLSDRQYSFKQVTPFSLENTVLDLLLLTFTILLKEMQWQCFFHPLLRGDLVQKRYCSPMKIMRLRQYSFQQVTEIPIVKKVPDPLASNVKDCLSTATVLLPFTLKGLFYRKLMFFTL